MTRHSPVVALLIKAHEKVAKNHVSESPAGKWRLATDGHGNLVKPTSPEAQYWSTDGAVISLEPAESANPKVWPSTTPIGQTALTYLDAAAEETEQGSVVFVDRQGLLAVSRMFKRAIQLAEIDEPENRRRSQRTAGQGHGTHPRGGEAA